MIASESFLNEINQEVSKSFQNVNYSQWQRTSLGASGLTGAAAAAAAAAATTTTTTSSSRKKYPTSEKPTPVTRMTLSYTKLSKPSDSNMYQPATTPQLPSSFKPNLSPLQYNYTNSPPIGPLVRDTSGGAGNTGSLRGSRYSSIPPHHTACSERKCSSLCNHLHKKTKVKTARELEDEERRINLLLTRIRFEKESIKALRLREYDMYERNKDLLNYIDKREKTVCGKVDEILRKYEKYQDVLKTIGRKHFDEVKQEREELEQLKSELELELPKYEEDSRRVDEELKQAEQLHKLLSTYKNQEYPEKVLKINTLKKKLEDINAVNKEETDNLSEMINRERQNMKRENFEIAHNIAERISKNSLDEMHDSLKDMATYNISLKKQIEFHRKLVADLKDEVKRLEDEVSDLKRDDRRQTKNVLFGHLFAKRTVCTPDMDVVLDIPKLSLNQNLKLTETK